MVKEIRIQKSPVHLPLLDEELKAALGPHYRGASTDSKGVRVFLDDGVPGEDEATALAITAAHDHTKRSAAERETEAAAARRGEAADRVNGADLGRLLRDVVVADDVADLREQVLNLTRVVRDLAVAQGHTPVTDEEV
jgi:hypothetical protein